MNTSVGRAMKLGLRQGLNREDLLLVGRLLPHERLLEDMDGCTSNTDFRSAAVIATVH